MDTQTAMPSILKLVGQPLILVGATCLWWALGSNDDATLATVIAVLACHALGDALRDLFASDQVHT